MSYRTSEYDDRYRQDCVDLMRNTWQFDRFFEGIRRENLANELFFDACLIDRTYAEVIVDEEDQVHGYLIGKSKGGTSSALKALVRGSSFGARFAGCFLMGDIGPRREALRVLKEFGRLSDRLENRRDVPGGYVNLFLVGSSLRGMGWGRRVMDGFVRYCKDNGDRGVWLWTDRGCNFGFYDHYGFNQIATVHSPLLEHPEEAYNGMVYTLTW